MTKDKIKAYRAIESTLKQIRKDIEMCERQMQKPGRLMSDIAKGSSPEFPYLPTRMKVESYDKSGQTKYIERMKRREKDLFDALAELEEWLEDIKDPVLYSIFRMKLRNNMSEEDIGKELGYSQQRINQLVRAALEED